MNYFIFCKGIFGSKGRNLGCDWYISIFLQLSLLCKRCNLTRQNEKTSVKKGILVSK